MRNIPIGSLIAQKRKTKKNLSKNLSFSYKKPLLGIFLDNELPQEKGEKMKTFLDGVAMLDIEVIVLADSNLELFSLPNIIILPYSRTNRKTLLDAADIALSFDFTDVEEMLLHGVIPITISRPEVSDYNPNHETGNSFIYKKDDPWCIFEALVRARETFKFPYDWEHIIRQGLGSIMGD